MTHTKNDIFIFAGEKSGDLHGSHLIRVLRQQLPYLHVWGVGGPKMRSEEMTCIRRTEDFEVIGFVDVLISLPTLWKKFHFIRDQILTSQPKIALFIDYPGFNLRMARALRQKGYQGKIIQYISPSVWAWGKKRIEIMAQNLDLLLTIYPFENKCFSHTSLDVNYVGNPLREYIKNYQYDEQWRAKEGIPLKEQFIALFPGSRLSEVKRNLPLQLEAASLLKRDLENIKFVVSCAHQETASLIRSSLAQYPLNLNHDIFLAPPKYSYEMMRDSHSAIAKSGTVTLELALHQRPTVVMYKASSLNRFIIKYFVRPQVNHFCIVNILANREVFPELIANGLTAQNLYSEIKKLTENGSYRQTCIKACQEVNQMLPIENTSEQAAQAILRQMDV